MVFIPLFLKSFFQTGLKSTQCREGSNICFFAPVHFTETFPKYLSLPISLCPVTLSSAQRGRSIRNDHEQKTTRPLFPKLNLHICVIETWIHAMNEKNSNTHDWQRKSIENDARPNTFKNVSRTVTTFISILLKRFSNLFSTFQFAKICTYNDVEQIPLTFASGCFRSIN